MKKYICTFLAAFLVISVFSRPVNAYNGMFNLYRDQPAGKHEGLYKYDNTLYLYSSDGISYQSYSGWTKTKKGDKRYYKTGDVCKGWRKINNKWYYFDFSTGNAVSGETFIAGGKYYFNDDYSWSGKLSKKSRYPDDFSLSLAVINMDNIEKYSIDAKSKTLIISSDIDEADKVIKISERDIQAFYSMMLSTGITDIKARVIGYNIENNNLITGFTPSPDEDNPEDYDYIWTDPEQYRFEITYSGESCIINGDDSAFLFVYSDETASKFCHMIWMISDYVKNL